MLFFLLDIIIIIVFILFLIGLFQYILSSMQPKQNTQISSKEDIIPDPRPKKRINPDTGFPMSTDKQIENAKQKFLDSLKPAKPNSSMSAKQIWKINQLNFVIPHYLNGDYHYKIGDWKEAEFQWIQIAELMPHAAEKLAIMYHKEKRYDDEISILKKAVASNELEKLYPNSKESLRTRLKKSVEQKIKRNQK